MIIKPNFRNVSILLADADTFLSQVIMQYLRAMGFHNIKHVKTGADAMRILRTQPISFLITEWDMKGSSGIELVRYLRLSNDSPNRSLPIIMLTGRGEQRDVEYARDIGITEFVVKPFTARALFGRIEQIIEQPRSFVIANSYVGPERRRRGNPPPGVGERRIRKALSAMSTKEVFKTSVDQAPLIVSPDFTIRHQLNIKHALSHIITPEVLKEAQASVDKLGEDSHSWIQEDLATIRKSYESLKLVYSPHHLEAIKEAALSIKARAGTFGYTMASDVARLLYLFLCSDYRPGNSRHPIVVEKHVEVLMVILAHKIKERAGVGEELYAELERLIELHR